MSVRDTVRNAWLKRFSEAGESELHESTKRQKSEEEEDTTPAREVISLLSEDEDEPTIVVPQKKLTTPTALSSPHSVKDDTLQPPFRPLHNPMYDSPRLHNALTINDILGSPTIIKSFLFSFQFELPFIFQAYSNKSVAITIVYQSGTVIDSPLRSSMNVSLIKVDMPPFSSHHPKLIINFHDDGTVKIYMISANLTETEFNYNNQFCWESPFLRRNVRSKETQFKKHLIEWIESYDKAQLKITLSNKLMNYDFEPIIGDFIASSSGNYKNYGYMSLRDSLIKLDLLPKSYDTETQILYQSSSVGAPYSSTKKGVANLLTHLLAPLIMNQQFPLENGPYSLKDFLSRVKAKLFLIYPSLKDIQNSEFGYHSGGWSHYNPTSKTGVPQHEILKEIMYHPYSKQRQSNTSHTKYLMVSKDNFRTLEWVLFTSANLSKTAWGSRMKKDGDVNISNYETGILISRKHYKGKDVKLVPTAIGEAKVLRANEVAIELPFELPPKKYGYGDKPWVISESCSELDSRGNKHERLDG